MVCAQHSKMGDDEKKALNTLTALVAGREDLISRIAAPLWARVGRRLDSDLLWARPLLGDRAPDLIIQALDGLNALDRDTRILQADGLSRLISSILGHSDPVSSSSNAR